MDIKPIHSERQHQAALQEIERLWAAKAGTPEHDRLEGPTGRFRWSLGSPGGPSRT